MKIEYRSTKELIPYVNNPRKNDKAVDKVAESISKFGFNVPITVDRFGVIATGHTRLKAAIKLGMTDVPVIVLDDLNPEEIAAWRLVDNRTSEIAEWDFPKLSEELKNIKTLDLSVFDFKLPDKDVGLHEDNFEVELPKKPKAKLGDIYELGKHRLICASSTDRESLEKLMDGKLADLIVTDPPYNVNYGSRGKQYKEKGGYQCGMNSRTILNDNMEDSVFLEFLIDVFKIAKDFLKPGGAYYVWHSDTKGFIFGEALTKAGLDVRQCLIWKKNSLVLGRQDYQWIHEPCLYGWKGGAGHYFINDRGFTTFYELDKPDYQSLSKPELIKIIKGLAEPKDAISVIEEDRPSKSAEHPTMKPVRLIGRLIANSSKKDELVLDMFGGSGTSIIASEQLGRRCYMVELDPKYIDVIIERWETYTGLKAKLVQREELKDEII